MMNILTWMQGLSLSTFVRESGSIWAFPMFLFFHTFGLALVAGGSAIIDFALLGMWPKAPVRPLERLFPVIWVGFLINALTGVSMFMADAQTKAIMPDFWIKMVFVFTGVYLAVRIRNRVFRQPGLDREPLHTQARVLAWASLGCWFGAILAGRLLAYV